MSSHLPPSVRRQQWELITGMAMATFVVTAGTLLFYTWHIGSPWGYFSDHWPALWYALKDLALRQSLDGWHYYWQQIYSFGWEYHFAAHVGVTATVSILFAYSTGRLFYYPGGRDRLRHISGPQLYWHNIAIKHARQQLKIERRDHPLLGLNIHPEITIPRVRESGNIFVGGAQGTGKTIFITPLIHQVITRGERAFVYDEKSEFTGLFYCPETSILIAPWDQRSQAWDISADANNAVRAQLISEQLISGSEDPLWSNGARMIFTGMIEALNHTNKKWGWVELSEMLSYDEVRLNQLLTQYYPRAARFIAENSKTTQSFFAQLIGSLGWIFTLAEAWPRAYQGGFSMSQWTNDPDTNKPIIFVQANKDFKDIGAPLASALIALMTSKILSQTNSTKRELWLFLDELANLPRNDSLMEWMSLGRSKGCRLVAGTQSISQIQQLYTEHGADSLLNMFTVFVSMRVGAPGETANYTARAFGERQVERPSSSTGPQGIRATNWHNETQAIVTGSDLVQLPQAGKGRGAEGYLLIPGWMAVYRLRWPISHLPKIAEEHCPAQWLNQITNQKPSNKTIRATVSRRDQLRRRRRNAVNEHH